MDKLTDLCGNRLSQNGFINTFCEMRTVTIRAGEADGIARRGSSGVLLACGYVTVWIDSMTALNAFVTVLSLP